MHSLHTDPQRVLRRVLAQHTPPPYSYPLSTDLPPFDPPLDPQQARAASHFEGPVRVLAPAGSGKTRTLTARIGRLLARGVPAARILALAFNRKAAAEMTDRLAGVTQDGVQARTFHSLGYEIVRAAGGPAYRAENHTALKEWIGRAASAALPIPEHPGEARRALESVHSVIERGKSNLTRYSEMEAMLEDAFHPVADLFIETIKVQQFHGWLTFSDMIYFALLALVDEHGLRETWQTRFDFILVDEFQDLNAAQMLLLRILAHPRENLFVVGDDDQLIYAWRGAREANILDFESMYPSAATVVLDTNYRSGKRIVRHGRRLIEHNTHRVEKDIAPAETASAGELELVLARTPEAQLDAAIRWMRDRRRRHALAWSAFGLLIRTNREGRLAAKALRINEIPFRSVPENEPPEEAPGEGRTGAAPGDAGGGEDVQGATGIHDAVSLLTVHKSKGVEFPFVVYFNMSLRTGTALRMEDERRVAYVGVTRAARGLLITAREGAYDPFLVELALDQGLEDFAEPFLERQLALLRRRRAWAQRDWRAWLQSFRAENEEYRSGDYAESEDRIAMELRFRKALRISRRP